MKPLRAVDVIHAVGVAGRAVSAALDSRRARILPHMLNSAGSVAAEWYVEALWHYLSKQSLLQGVSAIEVEFEQPATLADRQVFFSLPRPEADDLVMAFHVLRVAGEWRPQGAGAGGTNQDSPRQAPAPRRRRARSAAPSLRHRGPCAPSESRQAGLVAHDGRDDDGRGPPGGAIRRLRRLTSDSIPRGCTSCRDSRSLRWPTRRLRPTCSSTRSSRLKSPGSRAGRRHPRA